MIAALWLGSGVFLMLAASAAFRAAGSSTAAANVVGAMLTRWHYIALAAPLMLFALELRRVRRYLIVLLFAAIMLAALQSFVDVRIRTIRENSLVAISSLERTDPVRQQFGRLHGLSSFLLLLQTIAAALVVMSGDRATKENDSNASALGEKEHSPMTLDDDTIYAVVVNDEEQYSIWPADREPPLGWRLAGKQGTKEECLAYIEEVWIDRRPLSLRKAMDGTRE